MIGTDRRRMLQLTMAAAVAPIAFAPARATTPDRLIAPPNGQMRYCRTVVRELADGNSFTLCRRFVVDFRQFAGGFMIHGAQEGVAVDAPTALAEFAAIEEARDESGMFPIALDPFGQILSTEVAPPGGDDVNLAVDQALADLAHQPISAEERAQLSAFIVALQQAGNRVTAHLPTDLFAPASAPRREERRIALPGGGEGMVASAFEGERDGNTGLMRTAEREVVTMVAGSSKRLREEWVLEPL